MAILAPCPECHARFRVADESVGETVECPRCGATFTAPDTPAPKPPPLPRARRNDDDGDDDSRPSSRKPPPRRRPRDDDDDDDEYDDGPRPRRRRKPAPSNSGGLVIALVLVGAFVVVGAAAGYWAFGRKKADVAASSSAPPVTASEGSWSNNRGKIEGTKWTSVPGFVKGQRVPAGALRLEFGNNGSLVYHTPTGEYRGTYTLDTGDYVTWQFDRPLAGRNQHKQRVAIRGNRMTVSDSDGTSLDFEPQW